MKTFALAAASLVVASSSLLFAGTADAQSRGGGNTPRGSYAQSCSGAYVNQGRLYAQCDDRRGNSRSSSIELSRCTNSDIGNDNGTLVCYNHRGQSEGNRPSNDRPGHDRPGNDRPDYGRPGQGGGYGNDSITVYRDSNYRGQSLSFRSEVSNLRSSGMNDAISSIRLGRGDWEVCTDANFRGDCRIIRDDQRDLSRMGLNDKISSLRPVRRGGGYR